jgi:predicted transcriptional regulator
VEKTQIYLTEEEKQLIEKLANQTGESESAIIRQAIERYLDISNEKNRNQYLQAGKGLWKDREDIPNIRELREEFERFPENEK